MIDSSYYLRAWLAAAVLLSSTSALSSTAAASAKTPLVPSARVQRQIDFDVRTVLRRREVPGAVVAVIREGRVVYVRAFGLRDRERGLAVGVNTPFEIGSITKQFTAAAILQLREAGKIDIDATVSTYLPDALHAAEVTVRQLLSHTSGLPDYLDGPNIDEEATKAVTFSQLMDRIKGRPLDFAPGEKWAYSNTGYILLGRIIEVVSHQSYHDYIQAQMLDRVGMTETKTGADEAHLSGMAVGYRHVGVKMERAPTISESFGWAAGDIVSTIADLNKWNQALQSGSVVTAADYALMATSVKTRQGDAGYGLGLFVDEVEGQPRVGHTGGSFGFTTANEYFPKQRVQVIAFTNSGDRDPEPGEVLTQAIFDELFPSIAALATDPTAGVNLKALSEAKAIFASLQSGSEDYSRFNERIGGKLKGGAAAHFAEMFSTYGAATEFVFKGTRTSGDLQWSDYLIKFGPGSYLKFGLAMDREGKVAGISFG